MDLYDEKKKAEAKKIVEQAQGKVIADAICLIIGGRTHHEVRQLRERFASSEGNDCYLANQIIKWSEQ